MDFENPRRDEPEWQDLPGDGEALYGGDFGPPIDIIHEEPPERPVYDDNEISAEPGDFLTSYVVDLIDSGVDTVLAAAAEAGAVQPATAGGLNLVRVINLTEELHDTLTGIQGDGCFQFKIPIPRAGNVLPQRLELTVRARIENRTVGKNSDPGVWSEIRLFEPLVADVGTPAIRAAEASAADKADPWRVWLTLLGTTLIRRLRWALDHRTNLSLDHIQQALMDECYTKPGQVPGSPYASK